MNLTITDEQIGQRVAAVRRYRGLSQSDLARELGFRSSVSIVHREKGRVPWEVQEVAKIARVLDVEVMDLMLISDDLMKEIIRGTLLTGGAA